MSREPSEQEHRFTSTGIKFWRHRPQMEAYRRGEGATVVSTHVAPTGACNLKCPYCSTTYRESSASIPLGRIMHYVSLLKTRGLKAVILTGGGEPTSYRLFDELVKWLHYDARVRVALITNGTMARRVNAAVWPLFDWIRVSVNFFEGWESKIDLWGAGRRAPPGLVVGCSVVYTPKHETGADDWLDRFRSVSKLADRLGAKYVRVLPNCLLVEKDLEAEHDRLDRILSSVGDARFFHQWKLHAAPDEQRCHQAHFRPYLSEEPFREDGIPGSVYPCDSVVLNSPTPKDEGYAKFTAKYQICRPEDVLDFLDGKIGQPFLPRVDCAGCVFTHNVEMLGEWKRTGQGTFREDRLEHEEFV